MVSIKVKVEGSDRPITTLYQRNSSRVADCTSSVRDRCLLFAHDIPNNSSAKPMEAKELELLRRQPLSLSFLCERTILLRAYGYLSFPLNTAAFFSFFFYNNIHR